jgi:hypothetical protein
VCAVGRRESLRNPSGTRCATAEEVSINQRFASFPVPPISS